MSEFRQEKIPVKRAYTSGDFANLLNISTKSAQRLIDSGAIPHYLIPHTRRPWRMVLHEDVMTFIKSDVKYYKLLSRFDWSRAPRGLFPEEWVSQVRAGSSG